MSCIDVTIVGAGISGISAANFLKRAGLSVKILEARNQTGGRVRTDCDIFTYPKTAPKHLIGTKIPVELGASWIHGVGGGNPIYSLARKAQAPLVKSHWERVSVWSSTGQALPESVVLWWLKLMSDLTEFFEEEQDDPTLSISEALEEYLSLNGLGIKDITLNLSSKIASNMSSSSNDDDSIEADEMKVTIPKDLQRSLARMALVIAGEWEWAERMDVLSAKHCFDDGEQIGAHVMMPEGYWNFLEKSLIYDPDLPSDLANDIVLNAEVTQISQHRTRSSTHNDTLNVTINPRNSKSASTSPSPSASSLIPSKSTSNVNSKISSSNSLCSVCNKSHPTTSVLTKAGQEFKSKYVISTLPLGILKYDKVKFSPLLSDEKSVSIARIGYGILNKVYLQFEEAFWSGHSTSHTASDSDDSDTENFFSDSLKRNDEKLVHMMCWLNEGGDGRFTIGINYNALQPHSNILCIVSVGNDVNEIENKNDREIIEEVMNKLRSVYGNNIQNPIKYFITRWGKDPHSLGSYSSMVLGASKKDIEELGRREGQVHFAGEHTSPIYLGSVHGAFQSGIRAAEEILTRMNISSPSHLPTFEPPEELAED